MSRVVERGSGLLARLVAFVIGLPLAGTDIPITVSFRARQGREYWQRNFAGRRFRSVQEQGRGALRTSCCASDSARLDVGMALVCGERSHAARGPPLERVRIRCRGRWRRAEIPYEFVEAGRFHFHVEIDHPFTGLIVRYRGWLVPRR